MLLSVAVSAERCLSPAAARPRCLTWSPRPRWHDLLPGPLGVVYVTGSILAASVTGPSLFFIALVFGQLATSALLDAKGWSGAPAPLTAVRCLALAGAAGGAALSVASRVATPGDTPLPAVFGAIAGTILVGTVLPVQAVMLRLSSTRLSSRLQTTWWSFAVGLLTAAAALGVQAAVQPAAAADLGSRAAAAQWWSWIGGALGVLFVGGSVFIAPRIGTAAYFVCLVAGQLLAGAAIDATGAFGVATRALDVERIAGIAAVIVAAAAFAAPPALTAAANRAISCQRAPGRADDAALLAGSGAHDGEDSFLPIKAPPADAAAAETSGAAASLG